MADIAPQEFTGNCHAKVRSGPRKGEECGRPLANGNVVCRNHGGTLPQVRNAAALRVARDGATKEALKRLRADKASTADAVTEMDRLTAEVIVWKDICRERLDKALEMGEEIRYEGKTGEQLRAEVVLYTQALDRVNTVLSTNIKLGIHEKKVELEKAKAVLVVAAIRAILDRLDLTPAQARLAPALIKEEMLAISAEVL